MESRMTDLEIRMAETRVQVAHQAAVAEGQSIRLKEIETKIERLAERVTKNQVYLGLMIAILSTLGSALGSWVFSSLVQQ